MAEMQFLIDWPELGLPVFNYDIFYPITYFILWSTRYLFTQLLNRIRANHTLFIEINYFCLFGIKFVVKFQDPINKRNRNLIISAS